VKGGIEGAVVVVAHEDKTEPTAAGRGVAGGDDLAVGLDQDLVGGRVKVAELGYDLTAGAEGCVQRSAGRVTGERKVRSSAGWARLEGARDDDPAVGGQCNAVPRGAAAEVGHHRAAVAERTVEAAVGVIACQGKLVASARSGKAGDHDLAGGLDGD